MGPVRQNPIQRTVSLFICVCIALCTIVAHNIAQNRPDSFPPYPPACPTSWRKTAGIHIGWRNYVTVNVEPVYTLYNIRANKYCSVTNEQHLMDRFRTAMRLWRCDPKTADYEYAISIIHGAKTELRDFTTIFREFIRSEIEILFAQLINIHYIFAKAHVTRCRRDFISIGNYVAARYLPFCKTWSSLDQEFISCACAISRPAWRKVDSAIFGAHSVTHSQDDRTEFDAKYVEKRRSA